MLESKVKLLSVVIASVCFVKCKVVIYNRFYRNISSFSKYYFEKQGNILVTERKPRQNKFSCIILYWIICISQTTSRNMTNIVVLLMLCNTDHQNVRSQSVVRKHGILQQELCIRGGQINRLPVNICVSQWQWLPLNLIMFSLDLV